MSAMLFVGMNFSTEKKENGEIAVQQISPQLPAHGTHVSDNSEIRLVLCRVSVRAQSTE